MGKLIDAFGGLWKLILGVAALLAAVILFRRSRKFRDRQREHAHLAAEAWNLDNTTKVNVQVARKHRHKAIEAAEKAQEIRRKANAQLAKAKAGGLERQTRSLRDRFDAF